MCVCVYVCVRVYDGGCDVCDCVASIQPECVCMFVCLYVVWCVYVLCYAVLCCVACVLYRVWCGVVCVCVCVVLCCVACVLYRILQHPQDPNV